MLGLSVPLPLFSAPARFVFIFLLFFFADLLSVATSFNRFCIFEFIILNFDSFWRSLFFISLRRSVVLLWCCAFSSVIWNNYIWLFFISSVPFQRRLVRISTGGGRYAIFRSLICSRSNRIQTRLFLN